MNTYYELIFEGFWLQLSWILFETKLDNSSAVKITMNTL